MVRLFLLISVLNLTFAINIKVPKEFAEGYLVGKEVGKKDTVSYLNDLKEVLKIKRDIYSSKLPPCYIDKFGNLKLLGDYPLEGYTPLRKGIYVVIDTAPLTDVERGYLIYSLRKMLAVPSRLSFDRVAIYVRFTSASDAENFAKEVKKAFGIEPVIRIID